MLSEMEALSQSEIDFGIDELDDKDSDFDDDDDENDEEVEDDDEDEENYDKVLVSTLDEDDQDEESDGSLGDWAKLETMRSSHHMYFARKLAEPSAGIAIHGLLRRAFIEEQSVIQKQISGPESLDVDTNRISAEQLQEDIMQINGHMINM